MDFCAYNMLFSIGLSFLFLVKNVSMLSVRGSSWTMAAWIQWLSSKLTFLVNLRLRLRGFLLVFFLKKKIQRRLRDSESDGLSYQVSACARGIPSRRFARGLWLPNNLTQISSTSSLDWVRTIGSIYDNLGCLYINFECFVCSMRKHMPFDNWHQTM